MSTENQIHLKGGFRREEAVAVSAIKPGYLLDFDSDGKLQAHPTEGGRANRLVAEVDALQGNSLDDSYAADDIVSANFEQPGNEVQMFLKAGENVAIGDELISAGDGTLIANGSEDSSTTVQQVICEAREALDLSGSGDEDTLMAVLIR